MNQKALPTKLKLWLLCGCVLALSGADLAIKPEAVIKPLDVKTVEKLTKLETPSLPALDAVKKLNLINSIESLIMLAGRRDDSAYQRALEDGIKQYPEDARFKEAMGDL